MMLLNLPRSLPLLGLSATNASMRVPVSTLVGAAFALGAGEPVVIAFRNYLVKKKVAVWKEMVEVKLNRDSKVLSCWRFCTAVGVVYGTVGSTRGPAERHWFRSKDCYSQRPLVRHDTKPRL